MNIVFTGWKLLHERASGLLDRSLPDDEQLLLDNLLASYESDEIRLHALLSRVACSRRFVSFHVLVPGHWTVHAGLAHGIAGEWIDIHGTVGVLLWPLDLVALVIAVCSGKLMDEDWLRDGQFHHLVYSVHLFAWLLVALAVTLHLLAVLRLGGLPLARSMASVQLRPGDLPGNWFDQMRRSFKIRS